MRTGHQFFLVLFLAIAFTASSKEDTLQHARKSLYLSIAGTSIGGVGLIYESALLSGKHTDATSSWYWQAGISYPDFYDPYLMPQVGIGYCRSISANNRFCLYGGINTALLISLDPTPKSARDYYDSLGFYGGRYVNPAEPWLSIDLGFRINFSAITLKLQFTPLVNYDRVFENKIIIRPWGGISLGLKLK